MKKNIFRRKRFLLPVFTLLTLIITFHFTGYNHIYRALWYNFAGIDDYKIFHNRSINPSNDNQAWKYSDNFNQKELSSDFSTMLNTYKTTAFLVIKDKEIVLEKYPHEGYTDTSKTNSFSVAKSYVSSLIGFAIQDGYIKSVDQPVSDFIESFKTEDKKDITIKQVLLMSSGLNWEETYSGPFSMTTTAYYGKDLRALIDQQKRIEPSGKEFKYLSGNTQVLAFVIKEATGKNLATYLEEKLWKPLQCEQEAYWSLDKQDGIEKAYCCISSNARDFARFGQLYLDSGRWNNEQLLNKEYVLASVGKNEVCDDYGYQWWIIPNHKGQRIFYARGILGQYIICIPDKNIVIVRLGHERGEKAENSLHQKITFAMIDEVNRLFP
ncbi:MAG: serine hydrolase [Cytophagales bacterium]|nr:serine hydrolase [Cytophagales bacterium]